MPYTIVAPYYFTHLLIDGTHKIEIHNVNIVLTGDREKYQTKLTMSIPITFDPSVEILVGNLFTNQSAKAPIPPVLLKCLQEAAGQFGKVSNSVRDWFRYKVDQSLLEVEMCLHRGYLLCSEGSKNAVEFSGGGHVFAISHSNSWHIDDSDLNALREFVLNNEVEPTYWKLLRSVWHDRYQAESGSLLVAYNALEVAVKHWFANCYPNAGWLVFNLPAPPLVNLMDRIQNDESIAISFKIPREDYDIVKIKTISKLRNDLAHRADLAKNETNGRYISYIGLLVSRIDSIISGTNRDILIQFTKSCLDKK